MSNESSKSELMEIGFPGGLAVTARFRGREIVTDQPRRAGGDDTGPPPFDLFLAAIGTCVGFYALRFCQQRGIDTSGLAATLEPIRDSAARRFASIRIRLALPDGFPEKYHQAILRAVDLCAVKRHILEPPEFDIALAAPLLET